MAMPKWLQGVTCEEFSQTVTGEREKKPGLWLRLRMAWHLVLCVYCRRFLAQFRRIARLLRRDAAERPMPDAMRRELARKLGEKQ